MTVRELICALLEYNMDARVYIPNSVHTDEYAEIYDIDTTMYGNFVYINDKVSDQYAKET